MLDFLRDIWCMVKNLDGWILYGVSKAAEFIVQTMMDAVQAFISLLPDMPDPPEIPPMFADALKYLNWAAPVGFILTTFAGLMALWGAWLLLSIPLRWGKAVE